MYFKIFLTLLILFVSINLLSDLYNFYNTGVWEPFSATMEDNTKISKSLAFGTGDWITREFKKNPTQRLGQILINFNKDTFEQLQSQFQPNMDENKKKEIKNLLDKPGGLINIFRKYPMDGIDNLYFINKIEDKLNSHFKTKDTVSKSEAINIISEVALQPENRKRQFAENIYKQILGNKNKGDEFNKKFLEELILPGGKKLNLDKQSSPQSQQQPSSSMSSSEKSPQDLKSDWKQVGLDGDTVNCNGLVRYGANNSWVVKHSLGNIKCSSDIFGNHLPGVEKSCECKTTSWTNEERTENLTQKIFTKEKDLCVDPNKGGYVVYTGKACGANKNNIQWMNAYTSPDQAAKQYNKEGCNFQLTNEKLIAEYKNPTIKKGNLINTSVELPFNWKIEFSYTPTKRQNKSTNIFRLTDGANRNVDNYKDRLFFVFKRGEETDLEIGIGTKERNYIYYTNTKFKLNKTYKIKVDVRDTQMNVFIDDKLVHTKDITAKRDVIKNCHLYFSDKYYISAKCVVEDFSLTSSGSDKSWMEKYMGDCGKNPKLDKDRILQTSVSELLRYDKSGSSQSIEWHKTGQEKNTVHIPQPKPISKLTSDYIPFIDDDNRDWVPDYIDMVNPTATSNIHLGKYFAKKVSNLRGFKLPDIYQSEYELIGKTILRAEFSKRRGAEDVEMIKHKDKIVKLFDHLLGIETDTYTTINNKKNERQFSSVPVYTQPEETVKSQTSNMFSDNSNSSAKAKKDFNQSKYTNKYRPRDPNEYPRPIDAVWSFITGL